MNIQVNYTIGDRVSIDGQGDYKVVGYEYINGRGLRYVLLDGGQYKYQYGPEIQKIEQPTTIGFITTPIDG